MPYASVLETLSTLRASHIPHINKVNKDTFLYTACHATLYTGCFLSLNLDDRGLGSAVDTIKAKALVLSAKHEYVQLADILVPD